VGQAFASGGALFGARFYKPSSLSPSDEFGLTKNTVNRANKYLTVLVLAHLSINIIHGAAHRELHVNLPPAGMLFVIIVILLCPLLAWLCCGPPKNARAYSS